MFVKLAARGLSILMLIRIIGGLTRLSEANPIAPSSMLYRRTTGQKTKKTQEPTILME